MFDLYFLLEWTYVWLSKYFIAFKKEHGWLDHLLFSETNFRKERKGLFLSKLYTDFYRKFVTLFIGDKYHFSTPVTCQKSTLFGSNRNPQERWNRNSLCELLPNRFWKYAYKIYTHQIRIEYGTWILVSSWTSQNSVYRRIEKLW